MNLRSRGAIKPPKRYDEDNFTAPTPLPPACSESRGYQSNVRRPAFPSPTVDFNPNLPPAAFPTIDCQQQHKHSAQKTGRSSSNITKPMEEHAGASAFGRQDVANRQYKATTNRQQEMGGDGDVSMVDAVYGLGNNAPAAFNFNANNPYQLQSNSEHGLRSSLNLSNDENEIGPSASEAVKMSVKPRRQIKWSDISPTLQTEIFENLRSGCDFRRAADALRLNPSEQVKMIAHSNARQEQVQRENARLNEMRTKQLRALLRMDNSYLKTQKVPGQLVFRNISRKFLDTATGSGPDYSMSQASDILIARKYLRSLGLDPKLAGEWSNNLVTIATNGQADVDEDFEWTGEAPMMAEEDTISDGGDTERESSPDLETAPDDSSPSDCSPNPKQQRARGPKLNAAQQILLHRRRGSSASLSGTSTSLPCRVPTDRAGSPQWLPPSRPFHGTFPQKSSLAHESVVQLEVGAQGAARIQPDTFRSPGNLMQAPSQTPANVAYGNAGSANQFPPPWSRQPCSSKDGDCKALKRSLAGPWLYKQNWEDAEAASRASRMYRGNLAAARAEAQAALRVDSACHQSSPIFPYTNLMMTSPSNTYQMEGVMVEPLARWRSCPAGHGGNPEMMSTVGANTFPQYMSVSNHSRMEKEGPEYSPITPPSIETQWEQNEKQPHWKKLEACATLPTNNSRNLPLLTPTSFPSPYNAEVQGDSTSTSCSLPTNSEGLSTKQNSLDTTQSSGSPIPELEMTEATGESTVMETDHVQEKHTSSSTETAVPANPDVNTALCWPQENISTPLTLGTTKGLPKRKTRKAGNKWTKKKQRPSSKSMESLALAMAETTTQEPTKKATVSGSAVSVEATNNGRRRSTRVTKKAA